MENSNNSSYFAEGQTRKLAALSLELGGIFVIIISLLYDLLFEFDSNLGFGLVQIMGLTFGLISVLAAGIIYRSDSLLLRIKSIKLSSLILFLIGLFLLGINLIGQLIPLRNPAVYENIPFAGTDRSAQYTADQVIEQMNPIQPDDSSRKSYVKRLTTLIYDSTIHYWEADIDNSFRTQIPIHENFLLYLFSVIQNEDTQYEFCSAERAIERCASVCSQSSRILADILSSNNIPAHIITLDGHVVVRTKVAKKPSEWWILDADYGVVIEHDLSDIENDPELIRYEYKERNYTDGIINSLVEIYGLEGNAVIEKRFDCTREDNTYDLIWIIPVVAMLPFSIFLVMELLIRKRGRE